MNDLKCIETGNGIFVNCGNIKQEENVEDTAENFCSLEEEYLSDNIKEDPVTEAEIKAETFHQVNIKVEVSEDFSQPNNARKCQLNTARAILLDHNYFLSSDPPPTKQGPSGMNCYQYVKKAEALLCKRMTGPEKRNVSIKMHQPYQRQSLLKQVQKFTRDLISSQENKLKCSNFEVGAIFSSKEEVKSQVRTFCDSNFSPLVIQSCSVRGAKNSTLRISYKCPYGMLRKSQSTGKRQKSHQYVGCPVVLNVNQHVDGTFVVAKAELEHKEHDVSEESYSKYTKKLSKDEEEAVKAFLETKPSNKEVSKFLNDLTGKQYSTLFVRKYIVGKLKN